MHLTLFCRQAMGNLPASHLCFTRLASWDSLNIIQCPPAFKWHTTPCIGFSNKNRHSHCRSEGSPGNEPEDLWGEMMLKNPQKKSCLYNQHLKLNAFVRRTYPCSLKQTNMTKHEKVCTSYEEQLYDLHPGMRLIRLERWWSRSSEDSWETNLRECKSSISNPWSPQIRSCSNGQHLRLNIIAKKMCPSLSKTNQLHKHKHRQKDCSSCKTAWLWSASRSETYGTGKIVIQIHRLNPSSICKWYRVLQWRIFSFFHLGKKIGRRKKKPSTAKP